MARIHGYQSRRSKRKSGTKKRRRGLPRIVRLRGVGTTRMVSGTVTIGGNAVSMSGRRRLMSTRAKGQRRDSKGRFA